jgi:hypothetical protein
MLNILQAFLALAATMLALATLVTVVLEVIFRLSRRRFRIFSHLLREIFKKEIQPLLEDRLLARHGQNLQTVKGEIEAKLQTYLDEIRKSPLDPEKDVNPIKWLGGWLRTLGADQSNRMTTEEFIRRLARSQVGREIYRQASGGVDKVIESVSLRYEELRSAMREYVKNSSAILSVIIGIGLAFYCNIDAFRIAQFYIQNPDIAEKVAEKAGAYAENYEKAQERLQNAIKALEEPDSGKGDLKETAKKELEAIQADFNKIPGTVDSLKMIGVPIGHNYFPYASKSHPSDKDGWAFYFLWALKVFVSGVLIGLGGPFWYDAVRGLARATQMLRGRAEPSEPTSGAKPEETVLVQPAEIFDKHVEKDRSVATRWSQIWSQLADPPSVYPGPRWRPAVDFKIISTIADNKQVSSDEENADTSIHSKNK